MIQITVEELKAAQNPNSVVTSPLAKGDKVVWTSDKEVPYTDREGNAKTFTSLIGETAEKQFQMSIFQLANNVSFKQEDGSIVSAKAALCQESESGKVTVLNFVVEEAKPVMRDGKPVYPLGAYAGASDARNADKKNFNLQTWLAANPAARDNPKGHPYMDYVVTAM